MPDRLPPFSPAQAALLQAFLSSPLRPDGTMTYPQLAGFLFSIANGPELILPSERMPMVFNDREARYGTLEEAESVTQALMALSHDCGRIRTEERPSLPRRARERRVWSNWPTRSSHCFPMRWLNTRIWVDQSIRHGAKPASLARRCRLAAPWAETRLAPAEAGGRSRSVVARPETQLETISLC